MADDDIKNPIFGYRYNYKKDGIENTAKKFDADKMKGYLEALRNARAIGMSIPSPEHLAATALLEGRSDFGYNSYNTDNKQANALYNKLMGDPFFHSPKQAGFAAALLDKFQTAARLNIPEPKAWNGTGVNKETGLSGDDYAAAHQSTLDTAIPFPKNDKFLRFIKDNLRDPAPPPPAPSASTAPAPPPPEKSWWQKLIGENQPVQTDNPVGQDTDVTLPEDYSPGGRERLI